MIIDTEHEPTEAELEALDAELEGDYELDGTAEQSDANRRQKTEERLEDRHRKELEIALLEHEVSRARFLQTRIVASQECKTCGFARRYHMGRRCEGPNVYKKTGCERFEPYGI